MNHVHGVDAATPIRVALDGPDAHTELPTLVTWLRGYPGVGARALIDVAGAPVPHGRMGMDPTVVELLVDTGFQAVNLVVAVMAWREACRARTRVTLHRDGREPQALPPVEADPAVVEETARRLDGT